MGEREESLGFYEMLWDCEFCETKGLLAKSQRHCPECGAKQNADKRYFPQPGEEKRVEGHKYEGADRYCPHCNAPQSKLGTNCTNCGAPLDGSADVKRIAAAPEPPPRRRRARWPWILAAIGLVLALVLLVRWCTRTEERAATITAHAWETSIGVERYDSLSRAGWDDHVPPGAVAVGCVTRQRSTRQIPDGEDCRVEKVDRQDGTFEQVKKCRTRYRSEPIEGRWCTYTVHAWTEVERVRSSGKGLVTAWPAQGLPAEGGVREALGATRRGSKRAVYTLEIGGLDSPQRCEVSEAVWRKYADGAKATIEVRARNGEVVCSSL